MRPTRDELRDVRKWAEVPAVFERDIQTKSCARMLLAEIDALSEENKELAYLLSIYKNAHDHAKFVLPSTADRCKDVLEAHALKEHQ